jgi:hypothetical protein
LVCCRDRLNAIDFSTGHFVFKPIVQDRSTETPELSDPNAENPAATGHLLQRLGVNF